MLDTRRKIFIGFHEDDILEVQKFIDDFGPDGHDVFIPKALAVDGEMDLINSNDSEYVMSKIRSDYLLDSTVTIILLGSCTHSRRYIDWELKSSLRQGDLYIPNGVMGIILPSLGTTAHFPPRL